MIRATIACLLFALPAIAAAPTFKTPLAVLPFKNLNDDPDTDWLKLGIAETMLTDLKKAGTQVVERDQLDKALGEMLLQGQGGSDESTAVKVGKLVGAKTVVLGSFQEAGTEMRINARFVDVESGVILESAKSTGATARVFALQDEIVGKLLGKPPAPRAKPKEAKKTVQAYKLYAMSLATASDADRVGLLKKSLALDPAFVYAADELAALEKRLADYAKQRVVAAASLDKSAFALLADPKVAVHEKQWRAGALLTRHLGERKCRAAVADAQRVLDLDIPDPEPGIVGANESALNTMVTCYRMLHQDDLALQAGERLLKRFPAGAWYRHTDTTVREILEWRRKAPERAAQIDERFAQLTMEKQKEVEEGERLAARIAEIDKELATTPASVRRTLLEAEREQRGRSLATIASRIRNSDHQRCWFPKRLDPRRTVDECRAFQATYASDSVASTDLRSARQHEIEALAELGRWEDAIPAARAFVDAGPEDDGLVRNLRSTLQHTWPTDAVP